MWRAQRKALFAAEAKAIAAKDAESALKADVPSAAAISAANAIPAPRVAKPRAFWYKPSGVQSESARVTRWRDASKRKRDLVSVGDAQHSPKFEAGAKSVSFQHTGLQSESSVKLGNKFDVIAVLTFTGDVNSTSSPDPDPDPDPLPLPRSLLSLSRLLHMCNTPSHTISSPCCAVRSQSPTTVGVRRLRLW